MSGSGGGGNGGGGIGGGSGGGNGGGGGMSADACLLLFKRKALSSPNPVALGALKKGDRLLVESRGTALEIVSPGGVVCGRIISDIEDVIACIEAGNDYVAIVEDVASGRCTVTIRHQ
ncbi:hypothetical protein GCM10027048_19990 [Hymenobacter coalescens]